MRLAVLSSTRATDMDALVDAIRYEGLDAEISILIANKECIALEKAKGFDIKGVLLESKGKSREEYDAELSTILHQHKIDLILLIGYMRFLSKPFVDEWKHKIMNVHPSLLPKFAGGMDLNVHEEVLKAGEKVSGATLHFVDETADGGPIIFQKEVAIASDETAQTLKEKVQKAEGELLVHAVDLFGKGKIHVEGKKVRIEQ